MRLPGVRISIIYYLINANWLNQFKKLYEFDKLVKEVSKCPSIVKKKKNFKGEEKISFSEKTLCSLIKSLNFFA